MPKCKVGVQMPPQATTLEELRAAWQAADALGVDSLWLWDHFFPLYGNPEANHYEAYTLLGAIAVDTQYAQFGALVTCNSYRNANLLADMARNLWLLTEGRFVLGIGSGWFERDYEEYGYEFGTAPERLRALGESLPVIRERLGRLKPPAPDVPILIGGGGEKVTLRLVAEHAQIWNTFGPPSNFAAKNAVLDEWCAKVGRDPAEIERTVLVNGNAVDAIDDYVAAGAQHIIVTAGAPYDLEPVSRLLDAARG